MIGRLIKYGVMFVVLVLMQVLVLNQVQLSGYINPFIYVLFIMLLPVSTPRYLLLILGFLIGFVVDIFSNSLGIHAAATVFIAFVRPFVISSISTREEDRNEYPGLRQNKFSWFLSYTAIMVLLHHFVLFYLEYFTFSHFFLTFLRVLLSSVFSIFIIVLSQFIIFRE
ncbi:rod shape-determining protein MreD [Mariniphaga anaerophila]|uniref:Rod shape-determining protein MreD n=1 Tax=Mariniphaga anaerophila TaxID=1484053 RepID=A0A1M5FVS9_9BACT|nr:rod shape-determining protein MreD [Mariniphaga anaerophila]SHF95670.1 rod shape-determining protein MreD [Mariniphaga anaerophila]